MSNVPLDARQTQVLDVLTELANGVANEELDDIIRAADVAVTPTLRMRISASDTLSIDSHIVQNPETLRNRTIAPINGAFTPPTYPVTVVIPAANGGNITNSTGSPGVPLNIPVNLEYALIGLSITAAGLLTVTVGTPGAVPATLAYPSFPSGQYAIGMFLVQRSGAGFAALTAAGVYRFEMGIAAAILNPMTTAGDMIYAADGLGTPARLPIGPNGDLLSPVGGLPVWTSTITTDKVFNGNIGMGASDTYVPSAGFRVLGNKGGSLMVASTAAAIPDTELFAGVYFDGAYKYSRLNTGGMSVQMLPTATLTGNWIQYVSYQNVAHAADAAATGTLVGAVAGDGKHTWGASGSSVVHQGFGSVTFTAPTEVMTLSSTGSVKTQLVLISEAGTRTGRLVMEGTPGGTLAALSTDAASAVASLEGDLLVMGPSGRLIRFSTDSVNTDAYGLNGAWVFGRGGDGTKGHVFTSSGNTSLTVGGTSSDTAFGVSIIAAAGSGTAAATVRLTRAGGTASDWALRVPSGADALQIVSGGTPTVRVTFSTTTITSTIAYSGTSGSFSGALSGNTVTSTTSVSAVTGVFTGGVSMTTLTATSGLFSQSVNGDQTVRIENTNAGASAAATMELATSSTGASADVYASWAVEGNRYYSFGIDNSDADALKLTTSASFASPSSGTTLARITSAGAEWVLADGSVGTPALRFSTNPNTGIYRQGTDSIGFSSNSTLVMRTDPLGLIFASGMQVLMPDGGPSAPSYAFSGGTAEGIYRPTAGQLGFVGNSASRAYMVFAGGDAAFDMDTPPTAGGVITSGSTAAGWYFAVWTLVSGTRYRLYRAV